jgi:uncharacterized protein involved in exopolysaccharide biosynthesis
MSMELGERREDEEVYWDPRGPGRPGNGGFYALLLLAALAVMALGTVSGYLVANRASPVYGAQATIFYQGKRVEADDSSAERVIATQQALVESRTVLQPVADDAGVPVSHLEGSLDVQTGQNNVLTVTVGDRKPALALALAEGVSERYVDVLERTGSSRFEAGQRSLQRRIRALQPRARQDGSVGENARSRIGSFEQRLADLELERSAQARARVITPAFVLSDPLQPKPERGAAVGLLAGALIALAMVTALSRRRFRHYPR